MKVLQITFKSILISIIMFGIMLACNKEKSELDLLYDEVMEIHDDVMPKMRDIRKEIKKGEKSLNKGEELMQNDSLALVLILRDLKKSEEAMWSWMHNFDKKKGKGENGKTYLLDEKVSISNVKNLMLSSLEKSKSYHESHK